MPQSRHTTYISPSGAPGLVAGRDDADLTGGEHDKILTRGLSSGLPNSGTQRPRTRGKVAGGRGAPCERASLRHVDSAVQIPHEQLAQPMKRMALLGPAQARLAGVAIPVITGVRQGFRVPEFPPVAQRMERFRADSHICFPVFRSIAVASAVARLSARLLSPKGNILRANAG